jgi:molybdenum cofactor cytidylyltransferase
LISAILLAAGESRRMGRTKQLLSFGQSTILEETVKRLLDSMIDELIIVLGYDAERLRGSLLLRDKRIKFTVNPRYSEGMSSSIRCGVLSADSTAEAFLIALADQPLIRPEVINLLIDRYLSSRSGIVVPVYRGVKGHPVIFSKKYLKELASLSGDIGARRLLEKYAEDVETVKVDSAEILLDIDREEDYVKLKDEVL